jgi:hypothetical protein
MIFHGWYGAVSGRSAFRWRLAVSCHSAPPHQAKFAVSDYATIHAVLKLPAPPAKRSFGRAWPEITSLAGFGLPYQPRWADRDIFCRNWLTSAPAQRLLTVDRLAEQAFAAGVLRCAANQPVARRAILSKASSQKAKRSWTPALDAGLISAAQGVALRDRPLRDSEALGARRRRPAVRDGHPSRSRSDSSAVVTLEVEI